MLHACAARFDVTRNFKNIFSFWGQLNKALELVQSKQDTTPPFSIVIHFEFHLVLYICSKISVLLKYYY